MSSALSICWISKSADLSEGEGAEAMEAQCANAVCVRDCLDRFGFLMYGLGTGGGGLEIAGGEMGNAVDASISLLVLILSLCWVVGANARLGLCCFRHRCG